MSSTLTSDEVHVDELRLLEAEAVHIIREVAAELTRPVLLFSAGKDSIVLLRLAEKAFRPSPLPFVRQSADNELPAPAPWLARGAVLRSAR